MENIKVSVVMSVFNDEKYLRESIKSVINQSYANIEFIIIDDASTDNSSSIIDQYAREDSRIRFISNYENMGLTKSLNKAISHATGKYIARMDSDDISHPDRIKIQVEYMEEHSDVDICGTWAYRIKENRIIDAKLKRPVHDRNIKLRMLCGNPLIHPSVMMKTEIFESVKYDESYRSLQDYKLWADTWSKKFFNIPQYLLLYRNNSSGISRIGKKNKSSRLGYDKRIKKILLNELNCMDFTEEEIELYVKTINCLDYFSDYHEARHSLEIIKMVNKISSQKNIIPLYSRWARTNKHYILKLPIQSLFGFFCWFIEMLNIVYLPFDIVKFKSAWKNWIKKN